MSSRANGTDSLAGRKCDDWIETYLEYVENTEPPVIYHRWVGLFCIAAALQRRVYFDWGMERIYPNLYTVLIGPPANTRKSTALRIGEELIRELNLHMIGQENSREAIVRDIKKSNMSFNDGSAVRNQSAVVAVASELSVFLGKQNTELQADLTDWFDCPAEWKRTTKHQGVDDITGLCFNMLAAMTPDQIPQIFTPESIGGGFTSRLIFISASKKGRTIANPNRYPPPNGRRAKLLADLESISTMVGLFKFSKEAEEFYETWYTEDSNKMEQGVYAVQDRAFYAYCGRRATFLRKLSMVVSASRHSSQTIEVEDIQDALKYMVEIEDSMPGIFASVGRSAHSAIIATFKGLLKDRGQIKRSDFLRLASQDMSVDEFDLLERTLEASHEIKVTRLPEENDSRYMWVG